MSTTWSISPHILSFSEPTRIGEFAEFDELRKRLPKPPWHADSSNGKQRQSDERKPKVDDVLGAFSERQDGGRATVSVEARYANCHQPQLTSAATGVKSRYMSPTRGAESIRDRLRQMTDREGLPARPTHRADAAMPIITEPHAIWLEISANYEARTESWGQPPQQQEQEMDQYFPELLTEEQRRLEIDRLARIQRQKQLWKQSGITGYTDHESTRRIPSKAERKKARERLTTPKARRLESAPSRV